MTAALQSGLWVDGPGFGVRIRPLAAGVMLAPFGGRAMLARPGSWPISRATAREAPGILSKVELRNYLKTRFVTRASEKSEGKAAGGKRPEAWPCVTLRTFYAENAAIGLRSRPQ